MQLTKAEKYRVLGLLEEIDVFLRCGYEDYEKAKELSKQLNKFLDKLWKHIDD